MPNHVTNKLLFHPCTEKRFNEILADLQKEGAEKLLIFSLFLQLVHVQIYPFFPGFPVEKSVLQCM